MASTGFRDVTLACEKFACNPQRMIDILWDVQRSLRCIDDASMDLIAKLTGVHRIEVEGVVTFYSFFSREPQGEVVLRICDDIVDRHAGAEKIADILSEELGLPLGATSLDGRFTLTRASCIGMSDQAPAMLVNDVVMTSLTPDTARMVALALKEGAPPESLVTTQGEGSNVNPLIGSMIKNNIILKGAVLLDDTITAEAGLKRSVAMSPTAIVEEVIRAGLRGRGGAGFPTGKKLQSAAGVDAPRRFIICNADEGEPGTFKDRVLLTERADLLLEGMTIAAKGVCATEGILYLRAEYAYLRRWLEEKLAIRRTTGLLGTSILGTEGFTFDIRIQMGAGAYICGEESALIASCEGKRGEPKTRPPFPVEKGYLGFPTVVSNVESFCCVARILHKGSSWFASLGTEKSRGTKLLSISGDCAIPGVYEVPFGLTVAEVIEMAGGEDTAIVQVGGASGTMVGRGEFERRVAYEDLSTGGAVTLFSSQRNPLAIVESYLSFFVDESCGYCTPCRVGIVFMQKKIKKIIEGNGDRDDLRTLADLANVIMGTSRCGLGASAPRSALNSIASFPLVYTSLLTARGEGMQPGFSIQRALDEARHIARRTSMLYDPVYGGENQ